MKVAIMGAGLSGLSCALTLEKNGISPCIFENRSNVGDRFVNGEIFFSIMSRPVTDVVSFLSNEHSIYIKPTSNIGKLMIHSENEKAIIEGPLGFTSIRGREADSLENQLASQVKSKIHFKSHYTYEQLLSKFTHVVMATGDGTYAEKLHNYQRALTVSLKGATVEGVFDRYTVAAWLNHDLAPKGYGYLIPFSEKEANVVIGYPDYPENLSENIDELWHRFYKTVCQDLEQKLRITDQFEIRDYVIGTCKKPRIGNTLFTGNCFGSIMPLLGFGQFAAIMTGIYAANDLIGKGQYECLTKEIKSSYKNSLVLRKALESLDNTKLDLLVKSVNGSLGKKIFSDSKLDFLKGASYLLRPLINTK